MQKQITVGVLVLFTLVVLYELLFSDFLYDSGKEENNEINMVNYHNFDYPFDEYENENENENNKQNENEISKKKELNKCWEKKYNNGTSQKFCVPKNIVPGMAKCGTTFLYSVLSNHPQISHQEKKELNYYTVNYKESLEFYSNQFYDDFELLRLDNSPQYFFDLATPNRIAKRVPETRFLVMLRDPVQRSLSHYYYFLKTKEREGKDKKCKYRDYSFEQFLLEEYELLSKCGLIDWNISPPPFKDIKKLPNECMQFPCSSCETCFPYQEIPWSSITNLGGFIMRSLYFAPLYVYLQFFPRENFNVFRLEDFDEIGNEIMFNRVCDWLGIEQLNWEEYTDFSHKDQDYPDMAEETKIWLTEFYRVPNERLNSLMSLNFTWSS